MALVLVASLGNDVMLFYFWVTSLIWLFEQLGL